MPDFASAILFTLVARELARAGLVDAAPPPSVPVRGTVDKASKSSLLDAVHAAHGALPILRIGQGIRTAGPEPTLQALMQASGPADLLARWQRLERYVHSTHRVRSCEARADGVVLEHVSIRAGEAPSAAEDLLILGLLLALMEAIGTRGLRAALVVGKATLPVFRDRGFVDPGCAAATARWSIAWSNVDPARAPPADASPLPFPVAEGAQALVARVMALVMADCARTWTLEAVAPHVGTSARTLQRRLGEAGTSFSAVLRTAQIRKATTLLLEGALSVSEIGLLCGFSDQAHFTREFKRRTNIPPGRYRADFAGTHVGAFA